LGKCSEIRQAERSAQIIGDQWKCGLYISDHAKEETRRPDSRADLDPIPRPASLSAKLAVL